MSLTKESWEVRRDDSLIPADIIELQEQPCWKLSACGLSYHLHLKPQNVQILDRLIGDSVVKDQPANEEDIGDTGVIPGPGRPPGGGNGNPHKYSCLGNSMDQGASQAMVHGFAKR